MKFVLAIMSLILLVSGCGNKTGTTEPLEVRAIVGVGANSSTGMPCYDIKLFLTNTSGQDISFEGFDILLVNKEGKVVTMKETFPDHLKIVVGKVYSLDTSIPLPLSSES